MNDFIKVTGCNGGISYIRSEMITAMHKPSEESVTEVFILLSESPFIAKETPEEIMAMMKEEL